MSKNTFKKIVDILLNPFRKHFLFFIVFFLLFFGCFIYTKISVYSFNHNPVIAMTMHGLSVSYIVTALIDLIQSKVVKQILEVLLIFLGVIIFAVNYYCLNQFGELLDVDYAQLILETDMHEAAEFLTTMLPKKVVFTLTTIFFLIAFLKWLSKRQIWNLNLSHKTSIWAVGAICLCILVSIYKNPWKDGPFGLIYEIYKYDIPSDLESYYSHPQLIHVGNHELPINVVLIIGESFTRNHSSLYGYDKLTNPELEKLKNSSLLFSFDSIDSPAHSTSRSIKDMLSIYNQSDTIYDKQWYEYPSLIELMKDSGYDCYWFENQGQNGVHNACSRTYAQSCKRQWFLDQVKLNSGERRYDMILVDSSYQCVNQFKHKGHNFFIYHMMGSHFDFSQRYPEEFAMFSTNDYLSDPESHRVVLSTYDNSILYNDYVVKRIIDLFNDSESLVIYLSDHGQVMYRNKDYPDYFAHGVPMSPQNYALGIDIPFFVYASPLFQQKHPDVMERIKNRQEHPKSWNSEDLPYFIMDLIGVKTINGEEVRPRSVLN